MFRGSKLLEVLDVSGNKLKCDYNMSKFLNSLKTKKWLELAVLLPLLLGRTLKLLDFYVTAVKGLTETLVAKKLHVLKTIAKIMKLVNQPMRKYFWTAVTGESCKRNEVIGYKCICEESILVG